MDNANQLQAGTPQEDVGAKQEDQLCDTQVKHEPNHESDS
jgi:hypothetical protein